MDIPSKSENDKSGPTAIVGSCSSNESSGSSGSSWPFQPHLIEYYPFSTVIDFSFWHELSRLKLEKLGLKQEPVDIVAKWHVEYQSALPSLVKLSYDSFTTFEEIKQKSANDEDQHLYGQLIIFNKLEDFTKSDKRQLIIDHGEIIWTALTDVGKQQEVDDNLEYYLCRLFMIVYADLKKYNYHFWCAYPALNFPSKCFQIVHNETVEDFLNENQVFSF